MEGDHATADAVFTQTHDDAVAIAAFPSAMTALAGRGLIALEEERWDDADGLADEAVAIVDANHLGEYVASGLAFAVAARAAVRRGDAEAARSNALRAARLRPQYTYVLPVLAIVQLELAKAYAALGDAQGALAVLREMAGVVDHCPDLGVLPGQAEQLRSSLTTMRASPPGASSLTAAELRLVPYLATHLTFREIGERLYVSRHTVKTQAVAIYRKVGASSRSEAVEALRASGLLAR